ncbi:unnamed protein product [Ceutorhynchus assimilis]|uniref:Uncharacterized protein n=1 Tax=Ceutorhynchus assimilis TaxID=467358 RepID=A0A9N9QH85_9CUCU|nr:unnamed protein product [Ceutorhynchus assimilis]
MLVRRLDASIVREDSPEIPLTDALIWVSAAWKELSPEIVKNEFNRLCDSEITNYCDVKDNIPLPFLFSNTKYLDLKTYALVNEDLLTENSNPSDVQVKSEEQKLATSIKSL